MDDYAGRVLADRYRLPVPPSDDYELAEIRAFDTYSGQEVLIRQVPLPEIVEAEVLDADGLPEGYVARDAKARRSGDRATRRPADPAVRRAIEAAQAAAQIPDHPRLDQVFDVFAEGGSLWIVSELVSAQPLETLLAEKPLTPYRAAEVAADVLTALRALHAHGWVHRNVTSRTVLVCDDGRVVLTGLAAGAAEEALCGYDPVPVNDTQDEGVAGDPGGGPLTAGFRVPDDSLRAPRVPETFKGLEPRSSQGGAAPGAGVPDPETARRAAIEARAGNADAGADPSAGRRTPETGDDIRAARAGAIAAYRAGARAAARAHEQPEGPRGPALPDRRPVTGQLPAPGHMSDESGAVPGPGGPSAPTPPGQIADPYGVGSARPWHGAVPRPAAPAPAPASGPDDRAAGHGTHGGGGTSRHGVGVPPASGAPTTKSAAHAASPSTGHWDELAAAGTARRGPATALAAERARQARMAVVGPVTERWAPEQAGPVHENWQLAAPIGPATDLWALGALLFRAVQGHAPYPEDNTAELVQMVCSEPPAYAEECGPLRPVVESLLRQDPTERPDFEELRGWLRSLVRSAPEPEAGTYVVAAPPADPRRLPIKRRRGELVRRRRRTRKSDTSPHARHKRAKQERAKQERVKRKERPAETASFESAALFEPFESSTSFEPDRAHERSGAPGPSGSPVPRKLGRNLLLLVLLAMAAVIAYAMVFMPKSGTSGDSGADSRQTGAPGNAGPAPVPDVTDDPQPEQSAQEEETEPSESSASTRPQANEPEVAQGFTLRDDPEGFRVAVANGWDRAGRNGRGQVVYSQGSFELLVVPGRDSAETFGSDPLAYQREDERELQPFRDSTWATSSGMRLVEVGGRSMAEGQFTWQDEEGREIFVRNLAILIDGRYHVVQVRGPEAERDEVTRLYEQAYQTYQATG
ncbi:MULTISPECIES: protein kinase [Streptomyces]|uniref:protein kinase n=1 Tax=Streptomyces TaxID=1883 RepID=UPI00166FFC3B|nr:protein kinase [Streptomyces ruber]